MTQERRLVPRYRIESTIAVGEGIGRTLDLSSRGVYFETTERLAPGRDGGDRVSVRADRTGCLGQVHRRVVRVEPRGDCSGCGDLRAGVVQRAAQ